MGRVVVPRLPSYLDAHGLMPQLQSAYWRHHNTEVTLLKVFADIYPAIDRQQVTLLGLLDLSAAFDCVDHDILLHRLRFKFDIRGPALDWIFVVFEQSCATSFLQRTPVDNLLRLRSSCPCWDTGRRVVSIGHDHWQHF